MVRVGLLSTRETRALRDSRAANRSEGTWKARGARSLEEPFGVSLEQERDGGRLVPSATIFLTGAECPFTCVFCDLYQYTIDGPTPPGAIPRQIEVGLQQVEELRRVADLRFQEEALREESPLGATWVRGRCAQREGLVASARLGSLKLYNANSFFDERAVPGVDDDAILEQLRWLTSDSGLMDSSRARCMDGDPGEAPRLVVECHPRVLLSNSGKERCRRYAKEAHLEVAIGLETVAPGGLRALNKSCTLSDVQRAFEFALSCGATVRAFVLFGIPTTTTGEDPALQDGPSPDSVQKGSQQELWTLGSLRWARQQGARCATVIPVRSGNGAMEELASRGFWRPPSLEQVERLFAQGLKEQRAGFDVHLDVWNLDEVRPGNISSTEAEACRARLRACNLGATC